MCKFQISIVCVDEGKDSNRKLQVQVYGDSVPWSVEPLYTDKLASFQVLDQKFFLLNIYRSSKGDGVCDRAKKQLAETPSQGEKVVEMLHVNKDKASDDDKISRQDLHTTLTPKFMEHVPDKYVVDNKKCDQVADTNVNSNDGSPLRTVIINLEDWKPNQVFDFHVNTTAEAVPVNDIVLIPFDPNNTDEENSTSTPTTKEENSEVQESTPVDEPIRLQILVANSLTLTLQSSYKRINAPELNNNQGISSTKALLVREKCSEASQIALTDEGIPLVPTRKQIIRELIRERLRSLKMKEIDCNKFLETREHEFVQHRSLSVRLPLITRPNMSNLEDSQNSDANKAKSLSVPLSIAFEIQARYQTLMHHSDNLNKIINSAAVSAIEGSIYFILPHITTTPTGTKLSQISPSLVDDWLDIIYTAAYQLKPADPSHVQNLIEREMKQVTRAAQELLKNSRKTLIKCRKLNDIVLKKYRKARLPKITGDVNQVTTTTTNSQQPGGNSNNEQLHFPMSKADVGYSGFLQKMGVSASKLYPNHVYIAVGKYGVLLKKTLRDSWFLFDDLNYPERRVIFLGLMEHMQETIRAVGAAIRRIQELYVDGYPANVHSHLKIVFELIRDMNSGFELTEAMKANVLSQGTTIVESISRLVSVVHEIYVMAKVTYAKFHASYYDPNDAQHYMTRKPESKAARTQLIVPFSALATEGLATLKFRTEDTKDAKDPSPVPENNKDAKSKADVDLPIFEKVNLF